jgi:hypothetical protein
MEQLSLDLTLRRTRISDGPHDRGDLRRSEVCFCCIICRSHRCSKFWEGGVRHVSLPCGLPTSLAHSSADELRRSVCVCVHAIHHSALTRTTLSSSRREKVKGSKRRPGNFKLQAIPCAGWSSPRDGAMIWLPERRPNVRKAAVLWLHRTKYNARLFRRGARNRRKKAEKRGCDVSSAVRSSRD